MRYLTLDEVVELHRLILIQTGGASCIRDTGALDSAVVQPQMTFGGRDLYVTLVEKVAALGFSLVRTTRLSMGISASVTPRWKPFYC